MPLSVRAACLLQSYCIAKQAQQAPGICVLWGGLGVQRRGREQLRNDALQAVEGACAAL